MAIVAPVIIMMTPRSGSSMVTRIFKQHGLWVGAFGKKPGYPSYENNDLKIHIRKVWTGHRVGEAHLHEFAAGKGPHNVRDIVAEYVPEDTPWVYKTGIDTWPIWQNTYPGTRFVFVKRPIESVVVSAAKKSGKPQRHVRPIIEARMDFMDALAEKHGIPVVQSQQLIDGDYSTLESAFDYCGMGFNPAIAERCINKKMWKF